MGHCWNEEMVSRYLSQNYVPKMLDAVAGIARPGYLLKTTVEHDDWCGWFDGGACNCDPDIIVEVVDDVEDLL